MRIVVRAFLVLAFVLVIVAACIAWIFLDPRQGALWATIAATLAVITSLITAWNGQRALELQEDAQLPHPYPYIDASSRYQLLQLRIENFGGTTARDVRLEWDKP